MRVRRYPRAAVAGYMRPNGQGPAWRWVVLRDAGSVAMEGTAATYRPALGHALSSLAAVVDQLGRDDEHQGDDGE